MDEDTVVSLAFDKEKLYKNMVAAKADWLYELPQWKDIYPEEELKKLKDPRQDLIPVSAQIPEHKSGNPAHQPES